MGLESYLFAEKALVCVETCTHVSEATWTAIRRKKQGSREASI